LPQLRNQFGVSGVDADEVRGGRFAFGGEIWVGAGTEINFEDELREYFSTANRDFIAGQASQGARAARTPAAFARAIEETSYRFISKEKHETDAWLKPGPYTV
jgi:hypothetical protein